MTVRTMGDSEIWEIREVYYDDQGAVVNLSSDPVPAGGESWEECIADLVRMAKVPYMPVYDLDTGTWCGSDRAPL